MRWFCSEREISCNVQVNFSRGALRNEGEEKCSRWKMSLWMPIWMLACVAVVTGYLSLMLCAHSVSGNGKASCLEAFKVCLVAC